MTKVNGGFPVQETSREEPSSEMDPGLFPKTHLSQEETPHTPLNRGPNPKIYKENTKTSVETSKCEHVPINKTQEASVEVTLDGNGSTEWEHKGDVAGKPDDDILARHGGNASDHRIDHIDIYTAPPSGKLEDEGNMDKSNTIDLQNKTPTDPGRSNDDFPFTEETDAKDDHGLAFDGTRPNENSSKGLEHDSNAKEVIKPGNHPTMTVTSEDSATAGSKEDNLTLESHRSNNSVTTVFGSGHNGDVGYKNNSEQFAHHEVNISVSGSGQTVGNTSNFRIYGGTNTDACTTTTSCKLQGGPNVDQNNAIGLEEFNISRNNGGGKNQLSYCRQTINESDAKQDNPSAGPPQDATEVIKSDDHPAMTLKLDNSTTEEKINPTQEQYRSDISTKVFDSEHDGGVDHGPNDETLTRHEVNKTGACRIGGNIATDRGCNLSPSIFTNNDGTNGEAHVRGRRKDQGPEENISSSHGRDNNGLSRHRPKSQRQSWDSLATTIPTDAQQGGTGSVLTTLDDHVSLPHRSDICFPSETKMDEQSRSKRSSRRYNPRNTIKGLWNAFGTLLTLYIFWEMVIMAPMATAAPAQVIASQWRSFAFCAEKGSIIGQFGNFRNMEDRAANSCTVSFTRARFYNDCLEYGYLIFRINETCVEMLSEDLSTTHYTMEYEDTANGNTSNGHSVDGTAGERLTGAEVTAKIAEYIEPLKTTTPPLKGDNTTTLLQQKRSHVGIFGVFVPVISIIILYVLLYSYNNCVKFKRCVHSRGRNTNSASNTDNNGGDIPLQDIPNGHMNGRVPGEESQKQN